MCCRTMKFGVALLALVGLVVAAGPAPAALIVYDDFNDAGVSAGLWATNTAGLATVTFDGASVVLDKPTDFATGNIASMDATALAMQLTDTGDFFRMTWDLTLTSYLANFSFLGARFGSPSDGQKFMVVAGSQQATGRKNRFRAFGPPQVTTDGGYVMAEGDQLHYDVTATLTDAANNLAKITLNMYARNAALDATPELYSGEPLLETLTLTDAIINAGQSNTIGYFVGASVNDSGNTGTQERGTGTFDNVYSESGVIPEPASLVLLGFGLIGVAASRRRMS